MRYPVDRTSEDGLQTTIWQFEEYQQYMGAQVNLIVAIYQTGTRATRRHGWKWDKFYHRTERRNSNITADQVPLPDDVKAEALQLFFDSVTIGV